MAIAVTGAKGFIGSHLVELLKRKGKEVIEITKENTAEDLKKSLAKCDTIVHLAALNRGDLEEMYKINVNAVEQLIAALDAINAKPHIIFSSSTHQDADSHYGRSKRDGANLLKEWSKRTGAPLSILVIPGVFGDRCKPFYNSVVATFCYQLTHNQEPKLVEDREIELIHVNNLTKCFLYSVENRHEGIWEKRIEGDRIIKVSELLAILKRFMAMRKEDLVPDLTDSIEKDPFIRDLYITLDSYAEGDLRKHVPVIHADDRGELCEVLKLDRAGMVFFSTTKPGKIRGEHYHTHKIEKFCVIKGQGVIRMRNPDTNQIIEYHVKAPAYIDIPIFWPHNIENTGTDDMYTIFWASEIPRDDPDTFREKV